jgi:Ca2+:H+ antiporter
MVASVSLIVPAVMSSTSLPDSLEADTDSNILILSRSAAIILSILFVIYLYFQLKTHAFLFFNPLEDESVGNEEGDNYRVANEQVLTLSPWAAGCVLIAAMSCVIGCTSYLVDSVDGLAKAIGISNTFIGLVLIPTAGNAAKCVTTVAASITNRIDFTIIAIVSSVLQISLFVTPLLVLLGWILEQPMTLDFDIFSAVVFFLAILVVNYIIQGGRTNYFEGLMLVGTCVNCFPKL